MAFGAGEDDRERSEVLPSLPMRGVLRDFDDADIALFGASASLLRGRVQVRHQIREIVVATLIEQRVPVSCQGRWVVFKADYRVGFLRAILLDVN